MYCRFKYFKGIWNMYVEKTFHISLFLKGIDWDCLMNEWHLPNSTVPWFVSLAKTKSYVFFQMRKCMFILISAIPISISESKFAIVSGPTLTQNVHATEYIKSEEGKYLFWFLCQLLE